MDLSSVTTSYSALEKKYNDFRAPSVEITVGSTKLVSGKKCRVSYLDVELTVDNEASGACFSLVQVYEHSKTNFNDSISCLAIGEKVSIDVGYIKRESVFTGYISGVNYVLEGGNIHVEVQCMDAKGLLMKNRRMEFFTEKSSDKVVTKLLGESPVSSFISGKVIDTCAEEEVPLRAHQLTDYDVICEQAAKQGFEFFVLQGKVYFRKRQKVTSVVMELSPTEGILSARLSLSGDHLVKEVEVRSIDQEKGEQIAGSAKSSGSFGKSGSKLLGSSKQVFYEPGVKDANEAKARAQARIDAAEDTFGNLELECIGIPELAPGRFIKVKKCAETMNGKFYINYVKHVLDGNSFHTIVRARVNSL